MSLIYKMLAGFAVLLVVVAGGAYFVLSSSLLEAPLGGRHVVWWLAMTGLVLVAS